MSITKKLHGLPVKSKIDIWPLILQDVSEGSEEDDELTIPASDSSDDSDSEGDLDEAASLASSVAELSSGTLAV